MLQLKCEFPLILGENHPILRSVSDEVTLQAGGFSDDIKGFAEILAVLMHEYDGVGLAAPQIGRPIRMCATSQWKVDGDDFEHLGDTVMINPVILEASQETIETEEACLSLPGESGLVDRPRKIKVSYYDVHGKKHTKDYQDFNAVVIQHEIDHLDGILFLDKMKK